MKPVSPRKLHTRTGHYVRRAATEPISVTDRGQTVARLVPVTEPTGVSLAHRRLRPGFKRFLEKGFISRLRFRHPRHGALENALTHFPSLEIHPLRLSSPS